MVRRRQIDLHEIDMDMLHDWRILLEDYAEKISSFEHGDQHVVGFEIDYRDIEKNSRLHTSLINWTEECIERGNRVLFEQFQQFGQTVRPVLRISNYHDQSFHPLESLRMRDRGKIITTKIRVRKAKEYQGWLKSASYNCRGCKSPKVIPQRLGRNRERPEQCEVCFEKLMNRDPAPELGEILRFQPHFLLNTEECVYEDIQYLEVESNEGRDCRMTALVREEMVGRFTEGDLLDVIVLVRLDHLAKRNFEEDTRRVLLLEILNASKEK